MQPELLHLNLLIRDAAKILAGVIGEDIRLRLELSSTPIYFWGDAALFQRVLLNLASNARDAMPKGGELRIETRLEQLDAEQAQPLGLQPGPFALLRVHDTGHGISPQALRSIFEPFYTTQDSHQRHGLGLSVVHGIVEQHGGHVRVESQLGQGACFTIYLPALDPETTESSDEIAS